MYRLILTGFCLFFLSVSSYAYVNAGELLYTPSATMPNGGYAEYGLRGASYVEDKSAAKTDYRAFFKMSLVDNFQYGMSVGTDFSFRHSLQGKIFSSVNEEFGHHLALGVKNVGVVTANLITTEPVYDYYVVYSLDSIRNRTTYHIGYTYEMSESRVPMVTGGVEYRYGFGSTIFEWDGRASNFGLKYSTGKGQHVYFLISPTPVEIEGRFPVYYSIGFTFSENIFQTFTKEVVLKKDMKEEMLVLDHRIKAIEARENALADMMSVDFLSQLEESFIDRELIERKMSQETKGLVKGALAHMQVGLEHYYKGDFKKALEEYKVVTSLLPTFPMGYVRIGSIYFQLGDNYNAKKNWEKALRLNPKNKSLTEYLERMISKASYELPLDEKPVTPVVEVPIVPEVPDVPEVAEVSSNINAETDVVPTQNSELEALEAAARETVEAKSVESNE
jgi:hypothetical protein